MGIASAGMIAGWIAVSAATGLGSGPLAGTQTSADLARMAAQVEALKADSATQAPAVKTTAQRIEARQQFLDALLTGKAKGDALADLLPAKGSRASAETAASNGVLAPFAALEQKQIALLDKAAATAESRLKNAHQLISRVGLKPGRFMPASSGQTGMGGPYVPARADTATSDPRFSDVYQDWQRVERMESAMASLPSFVPTKNYSLSSTYGNRSDPFTGRGARHSGLDMAGKTGEPIYAAAEGKVVRAGWFGGYGYCIDIDHGHGIVTRYGHLSAMHVKVGDKIEMGRKIAAMGSTGRSTGPHLHYEVRIDGTPVDPRPFIEASSYLLAFHNKEVAGPSLAALR